MKKIEASNYSLSYSNILNFYKGKKCIITGHTGFKGTWLSILLKRLGADVTGFSLEPPSEPNLYDLSGIKEHLQDIRGDVRNIHELTKIIREAKPDLIFHLAAQPIVRMSFEKPKETYDINVGGTVNLLEALRLVDFPCSLVLVTSDKCYENKQWTYPYRENDRLGGSDLYSASKAGVEMISLAYAKSFFNDYRIKIATARAGNVIGGGDWGKYRIIPDIVRAVILNESIKVRNPTAVRPWQHVLDALFGYLLLGRYITENRISYESTTDLGWNFGPEHISCKTVENLVELFISNYGSGKWIDISKKRRFEKKEEKILLLDWNKAYQQLGWIPKWNFEQTVKKTSSWYSSFLGNQDPFDLCVDDINTYLYK